MSGGWGYYSGPRPTARPVKGGIRAKSQRGAMGQAWWSRQWIAALERILDAGRLGRGRSYARRGQVVDIAIGPRGITAKVQGSRAKPYAVALALAPLDDGAWARVLDALAAEARFSAQLLAGEMPNDVEDAFLGAGMHLLPYTAADLKTDCSCPDWSNPCKHVAAVHYLLAEALDDDPFLVFQLRGRDRAAVLAGLAERRTGAGAGSDDAASPEPTSGRGAGAPAKAGRKRKGGVHGDEAAAPAASDDVAGVAGGEITDSAPLDVAAFWQRGAPLDGIVTPPAPAGGAPALLRRLGQPSFTAVDVLLALGPVYAAVAARAAELGGLVRETTATSRSDAP